MAEKTCKLKVVGLPPDLTADQLTIIFKNKRGKGGGPVENVELKNDGQNLFAIITFSAPDAVELIMSRGNTVAIRDVEANVEPLYDQIKTVQKSSPLGDIEDVKTVPDKPMKKPKPIKPKIAQSEKLYKPSINTKPVAPEFYFATSNDKKDTEIFPWDLTVKAFLAELSQTREFYKYYLEDEDINKAPFDEESLMLDGVNKVFYVTFQDRKGAMAFCNKKHNLNDSNITKVQMTTQEDFNTFDNLLFIYGYNIQIEDDLEYLKELVNEHSHLDVLDIIHYEEAPGSAIIVFEPETDITAATWLCTTPSLSKQNLITGLVFKEYGILVTGLNDSITLPYLKRYMQNKSNGGGKVKSVNYESSNSAVVTFEEESDHHNILQKEDHVLDGTQLTLSPFYTCLSKEYQKKFHLGETTPIKSPPQFTVGKAPAVGKTNIQSVALRNKQIHLYTTDRVKNEQKRYFGFLTLINFGFEFLRKHQQQLEEVVRKQSCEMELLPNLLKLKLNWLQRVTGKEVREMLNVGLTAVKQHLDKFTVVQFEIPEPEIFSFQSFCQKHGDMGIFFDHGWKKAVVIGLETPQNFVNMMNDMFSAYLSQRDAEGTFVKNKESKEDFRQRLRPQVKPKPGFLQGKTFQAPVDGSENFQAPSQAPPQASPQAPPQALPQAPPQAPTLEDVSTQETFNIEKFLDLETYELMLLDKSKFLVEIEEKYKPIKVVLDFENKKVVFKANESDKVGSAQFDVLKKSKDDFQKLKLNDLSPEQLELLKHSDVLSRINSNLNYAHLQVSGDGMVTLFYIKPEEPGRLKEKIMTEIYVVPKPVDSDMVTMLKSSEGSKFLTDLSAPIDGIKMRSVIKLDPHGKHLMIIAPKNQQVLLNKSVEDFLEKNKLHTINVPFSSGKLAFVNRYLKHEVARIASSLGSDVAMKPTSESYAIKGLQDVAKKCSALMKQLSDTIVVQDVNLKFFGIQEFLEDAQGKTLIRNIEDRNMCIIFSKSDLDKLSKQQALGKPQIQGKPQMAAKPRKPPTLIAKSVIKNITVHFLQGDLINLNVDAIVNPLDATLEMSSPMSKALVSQGGQEILTALKSSSSDVSVGSIITTPPGQLSNMKHILHVVCPVNENEEEVDDLKRALASCLQQAESQNITSVGLPAVGVGKHFKFPARAACNCLINAIYNYIEEGTTLNKIYLCDFKSDVVQMMMDRFEDFSESALEPIATLQASDTKGVSLPDGFFTKRNSQRPSSSHSSHAAKDFGHIKFNLVLGEINKQKADVMVTTVDKNLDLSKGRLAKTIASEGGPQLQQELRDNYNDGLKPGEFAESSGGSLPCKHIFYAYLPRYRQGQESIIEKLVFKLLEKAEQCQAATIALPALGTGNLGYPLEISADLITDAVCQFAKKYKKTTLKSVNLVVFHKDKDVEQAFNTVLSTGGKRGGKEDEPQGSGGDAHHGAGYFGRLTSRLPFGNSQKGEDTVIMYHKTKLKIKSGDITKEKCDGLVNSIKENMDLSSSGQVCKALLRICGQELQDECTNKISEMAQEGVVSTSGSKLKCKHILHISQDKFTRHWDKGVTKVLEEADKLGIKTLALPALGAGSRHADVQVIKKQILGAIEQFSATGRHTLSYIKLVIFDRNVLDAFLGHSSRGADSVNEPEGEHVIHKEYSQNMDLKIYCNDAIKMKSAIDQLKKECKAAFKEEKEKESKVKMLDKAQLKELERIGLKNGIQVQVRVEEGLMLMHGFNASGMLAVQRCLQKFVVEAVDSHHKSLHKAMVSAIDWEYKKGDRWHKFEPLLNSELEKEFKNKSSQHELTDAKGRKYIIDFKEMKETLVNDRGSKRCVYDIQRRDKTKEGEPVPRKWDPMSESENLKIVLVKHGSQEYKTVEQHFINGGAQVPIKKIERIQNKTLYKQYSVRKRDLDIHNPKGHKNELKLFHGTSAAPVPQINENGFNRSYCGVNGVVYGNGVYFHMRSSYSVSYAKPDSQGNRHMYQAKVLVGESTPCSSGMSVLPNKPGTNRTYDSGNSGEIYVIFHDANAYPEYLITF